MFNYNKGLLAEILEPIMGKGLIPADLETWKVRRKVLTPAFHDQYIRAMTSMFARCCLETVEKFNALLEVSASQSTIVNMEDEFLNLALDIIGVGVFNFNFKSTIQESPVIKVKHPIMADGIQHKECPLGCLRCLEGSRASIDILLSLLEHPWCQFPAATSSTIPLADCTAARKLRSLDLNCQGIG